MSFFATRRAALGVSLVALASTLTACSSASSLPENPVSETSPTADTQGRSIVVYFSQPETLEAENMTEEEANSTVVIDGEVLGNVQYLAQLIQQGTGSEVFRLETAAELPRDHEELVAPAVEQRNAQARPALKELPDLSGYDTVYVGYPIWWVDLPMHMYTFFEQADLAGKQVRIFSSHGGSGLAGTVEIITGLLPDSTVVQEACTISRNAMDTAPQEIPAWLSRLG